MSLASVASMILGVPITVDPVNPCVNALIVFFLSFGAGGAGETGGAGGAGGSGGAGGAGGAGGSTCSVVCSNSVTGSGCV